MLDRTIFLLPNAEVDLIRLSSAQRQMVRVDTLHSRAASLIVNKSGAAASGLLCFTIHHPSIDCADGGIPSTAAGPVISAIWRSE
jgi:hypothetical protein